MYRLNMFVENCFSTFKSHFVGFFKQTNQIFDIMPSIEIIELSNVKQLPHLESPVKVLEQIKILFAEKM